MSKSAVAVNWYAKAEIFDAKNPHIYEEFKRRAYQLINNGIIRYSARGIFAVMAFDISISTNSTDKYKINVNLTPYYSRKFLDEHPQYPKFFRTKRIPTDLVE